MGNNLENTKIQWHSGFYGAAELEFGSDKEVLEFNREYNLSKEPLRMDLLIIKKVANVPIKNEIGRMFRTYNVVEYKSPDDSLSISDYYKTIAYACLYKGLEGRANEIPAREVTVSLVRDRYPRELFKALRGQGMTIEEPFRGIYYIKGSTLFDTQVIVTKRLDPKTHCGLRVLSTDARREDVEGFLENAGKLTDPGDRNNIEAVLQVSVAANQGLYNEVRRDWVMWDALKELMREEIEEEKKNAVEIAVESAVENAIQKTVRETLIETIRSLMANLKLTADQAMSAMDIPTEKWEEYRAKL